MLDLVTKAEMEREDYRLESSPNVFFGTIKTYSLLPHKPEAEPPLNSLEAVQSFTGEKAKKPWWQEIKINTLWMNFTFMMITLAGIIITVHWALRRQLSRV